MTWQFFGLVAAILFSAGVVAEDGKAEIAAAATLAAGVFTGLAAGTVWLW